MQKVTDSWADHPGPHSHGLHCRPGSWLPAVSSQEEVALQVSALQAPPGGLHGLQSTVMIRSVLYRIPLNGPLKAS